MGFRVYVYVYVEREIRYWLGRYEYAYVYISILVCIYSMYTLYSYNKIVSVYGERVFIWVYM